MSRSSRTLLTLGLLALPTMAQATEPQAPLTGEVRVYLQPLCNLFRVRGPDTTAAARSDDRPVSPPPELLSVKTLRVIAQPEDTIHFHGRLEGFRVWVVNGTDREQPFSTTGSQLAMLREVLDSTGQWRPIETMPGRPCGDARHSVRLPPGQAWLLGIPRTDGPWSTAMRFRLESADGPIYSNAFPAKIDPRLLDVKRDP